VVGKLSIWLPSSPSLSLYSWMPPESTAGADSSVGAVSTALSVAGDGSVVLVLQVVQAMIRNANDTSRMVLRSMNSSLKFNRQ
jgi:hypothetical protein